MTPMNHTILSIKSKLKRLPLLARIFNKAQANPREAKIMRYITKEMTGLEIAPYFTPLAFAMGLVTCRNDRGVDVFCHLNHFGGIVVSGVNLVE